MEQLCLKCVGMAKVSGTFSLRGVTGLDYGFMTSAEGRVLLGGAGGLMKELH